MTLRFTGKIKLSEERTQLYFVRVQAFVSSFLRNTLNSIHQPQLPFFFGSVNTAQ